MKRWVVHLPRGLPEVWYGSFSKSQVRMLVVQRGILLFWGSYAPSQSISVCHLTDQRILAVKRVLRLPEAFLKLAGWGRVGAPSVCVSLLWAQPASLVPSLCPAQLPTSSRFGSSRNCSLKFLPLSIQRPSNATPTLSGQYIIFINSLSSFWFYFHSYQSQFKRSSHSFGREVSASIRYQISLNRTLFSETILLGCHHNISDIVKI